MKILAIASAFERALSAEIAASELLRVRVLAAALAVLLVAEQLLFLFARNLVEQVTEKPLPEQHGCGLGRGQATRSTNTGLSKMPAAIISHCAQIGTLPMA